ncbi:hypothetical protein J4E89_009087 [Alternaria sp. Ai002NY15]|nr:hypothetical protein J4E89_009087 [Alternaria sp. Ai002NY15]
MNPLCQRPLTRTHISERNAAASPLLRLPPELRNSIFAYALYHETFVLDPPDSSRYVVKSRDKNLLSLLYVCRQVYSETAFLPYKLNSFEICRDSPVSLVAFLKRRTATQTELMQDVIRRWKYVKTRWERRWLFYRHTYNFNPPPSLSRFVSNVHARFSDQNPSHDYGMLSPKKRSEGAKPDLAPLTHPMPNEIVDSTSDRSTELAIASHPAAARDEISKRNADSPLLRLPAELRNHIFALALTQGDIKWNYGAWLKNKNSVNLLYVCLASTKRNATSSPLLRLPPEIRNHIFSLALNHGYIPIIFPERSHRWKIKRAGRRGFEYRYHYKQFCNIFYNPISFSARSCSFKLKKRPVRNSKRLNHLKRPVNLLFVCRQIHAETALLPYKVNTWVIELNRPWERIREGYERYYWHDPMHFVEKLTAIQREVMEKVWSVDEFGGKHTITSPSTNFTAISKDVENDMSALDQQSESERDQISQQNAKSPLLRLPAELRNQIFALALTQPTIEIFWSEPHLKFKFHEDCRPDYVRQPLNLLFVCRQTHAETATLPYKLNTFAVDFVYQRDPPKNFLYQRTVEQREVMGSVSERNPETGKAGKPMSATRWMASMEADAFVLYTWKRGEMEA